MKNRWRWILLTILIILMIPSSIWFYWRLGGFMNLEGKLLVSLLSNDSPYLEQEEKLLSENIYAISLEKEISMKEYFSESNYGQINFPLKRKDDFICMAKERDTGRYIILQAKENMLKVLVESDNPISFPLLLKNDEEIVCIRQDGKMEDDYYIYKYDINNHIWIKIYNKPVVHGSQLIEAPDGSIIFAEIEQVNNHFVVRSSIRRLYPTGKLETIATGIRPVFPTWLEEGQSLLFYDNGVLMQYDLVTQTTKILVRDLIILSQPVVSKDKKYIALVESVQIPFGGLPEDRLRVMTLDGWSKREIHIYGGRFFGGSISSIDWID